MVIVITYKVLVKQTIHVTLTSALALKSVQISIFHIADAVRPATMGLKDGSDVFYKSRVQSEACSDSDGRPWLPPSAMQD